MFHEPQFGITYSEKLKPGRNPVWFVSEGLKLAGNLFTPSDFDESHKYPAIVTVNPAGAIKEQSAGFYSYKIRDAGFILLAFDNRTWGESEGWPRYREDPFMKVEDTKNALTFMHPLLRALATRYDKLAESFLGGIYLAAIVIWLN